MYMSACVHVCMYADYMFRHLCMIAYLHCVCLFLFVSGCLCLSLFVAAVLDEFCKTFGFQDYRATATAAMATIACAGEGFSWAKPIYDLQGG